MQQSEWIKYMNPSIALTDYCKRHGYSIVKEYTTSGYHMFGVYYRAVVVDSDNNEYCLYYDSSVRKGNLRRQKIDFQKTQTGRPIFHKVRGWRNTTLDNRRKRERLTRLNS